MVGYLYPQRIQSFCRRWSHTLGDLEKQKHSFFKLTGKNFFHCISFLLYETLAPMTFLKFRISQKTVNTFHDKVSNITTLPFRPPCLYHGDLHTTFFCTAHDAGVVKDARF